MAEDLSQKVLITYEDMSYLASVSKNTAAGWVLQGKIPAVRLGRSVRVKRTDFEAFLESQKAATDVDVE